MASAPIVSLPGGGAQFERHLLHEAFLISIPSPSQK